MQCPTLTWLLQTVQPESASSASTPKKPHLDQSCDFSTCHDAVAASLCYAMQTQQQTVCYKLLLRCISSCGDNTLKCKTRHQISPGTCRCTVANVVLQSLKSAAQLADTSQKKGGNQFSSGEKSKMALAATEQIKLSCKPGSQPNQLLNLTAVSCCHRRHQCSHIAASLHQPSAAIAG